MGDFEYPPPSVKFARSHSTRSMATDSARRMRSSSHFGFAIWKCMPLVLTPWIHGYLSITESSTLFIISSTSASSRARHMKKLFVW